MLQAKMEYLLCRICCNKIVPMVAACLKCYSTFKGLLAKHKCAAVKFGAKMPVFVAQVGGNKHKTKTKKDTVTE